MQDEKKGGIRIEVIIIDCSGQGHQKEHHPEWVRQVAEFLKESRLIEKLERLHRMRSRYN